MVRLLIKYVRLALVLAPFALEVKLLIVILAINHFYITLLPQPVQLSVLWDGFNRHLIFIYVYHAILSVKVAKIIDAASLFAKVVQMVKKYVHVCHGRFPDRLKLSW